MDKITTDIKTELNSESVRSKKFLKTKTKSYGDEATDFHDKEVPKVNSIYTYLAVIPPDSTLKIKSLKKVTSTISK